MKRTLASLSLVPLLVGCTAIAERVATRLADDSLKHHGVLTLVEGDVALFRRCLQERGGTCQGSAATALPGAAGNGAAATPVTAAVGPSTSSSLARLPPGHPARLAAATLGHPTLANAVRLHNHLRGHPTDSSPDFGVTSTTTDGVHESTVTLHVSVSQTQDFMEQVQRTTAAGGWDALADHTAAELSKNPDDDVLAKDHRRAAYIKKYLDAYFRNGRFIAVDFTIDAARAQQDLAEQLSRHSATACRVFNATQKAGSPAASGDSADCGGLAKALYEALRGSGASVDHQLVKISQTGFVARDGGWSAQFPSFEVDLDPLASRLLTLTAKQEGAAVGSIDFTTIGVEMVRVVLEAIFDAHEGLPAVATATGRDLGGDSLPLFDPAADNVSAEDFNEMTRINDRVFAATGVVLDRLIRGIGPLSLGNEALEELIVTLVTTSVEKAVEKGTWCWYACNLDVEAKRAAAAIRDASSKGEAKLEGKLEAFSHQAAERVKLDLRVGS